jgi:prepilin-type N-terminal cleavage/methylation domain-containing protein
MRKGDERGFTLIELLIVVAIILVVAAIAIPNLIRSGMSANESSAVGSLRTLNTAQDTYNITYPNVGFATTFGALGPPASGNPSSTSAGLVDNVLGCSTATCNKSGYVFSLSATNAAYGLWGSPHFPGSSGVRYFYTDSSGVIRYNTTAPASSGDSPI